MSLMRKKWLLLIALMIFLLWALWPRSEEGEVEAVYPPVSIQWDREELIGKLKALPREKLEGMQRAGEEIAKWERVLRKSHSNVVREVLSSFDTFYEFEKYPQGDVIDRENHSQYYYHAHREGEHGHFHTFVINGSAAPSHVVAISMDRQGRAKGLFTTNQWVTAETVRTAQELLPMIDRFQIELAEPSWLSNRWVGAMLTLFYPQIISLIEKRDRVFEEAVSLQRFYKDRSREVLVEMPISIEEQMEAIQMALYSDEQCSSS